MGPSGGCGCRERGKEQRGEEKALLQSLQEQEAALSAAVQHLRQQWQVLNALGAVGMRQASTTFVARYTTIEATLSAAQDNIAANIHNADPVALQAANNGAVVRPLLLRGVKVAGLCPGVGRVSCDTRCTRCACCA